jgi:hypothetical protein
MRCAYYCLANISDGSREHQWIQSIRSLRMYNRFIPVWLFLFNTASSGLLREAERHHVRVRFLGDYEEFLQRAHPRGSVLAFYPTFHKFLVLAQLPLPGLTQLLYLDCDTFFFDDVTVLFDHHGSSDWYAREEPTSLGSPFPYDPKHVDEDLLKDIARKKHLSYIPPFNSGVCLLNHQVWHRLIAVYETYLRFAWRLLCGRELSGDESARHFSGWAAVLDSLSDSERAEALPYPSKNQWIIEQIALWLTLGSLQRFSLGLFQPKLVAQGNEFESMVEPHGCCVVAHYFSGGEGNFFSRFPALT